MSGRILELHGVLGRTAGAGAGDWRPGDEALLTLAMTHEGEGEVVWPTSEEMEQALAGKASVLAEAPAAPAATAAAPGGGRPEARTWRIQLLLAPGDHEIGPFPLSLRDAAGTVLDRADVPTVAVHVSTVLPEDVARTLDGLGQDPSLQQVVLEHAAPPRGPWRLVGPTWPLVAAAVAAALVLGLFVLWWIRRHRRSAPVRLVPAEPPEVVARRRLAVLLAAGHLERGEHLAFHVELADILKSYLDARHGWDLRERTTDEVRALLAGQLRAWPRVDEIRADVLGVLDRCDFVKFARFAPPRAESLALAETVSGVIDLTTRPMPLPVAS